MKFLFEKSQHTSPQTTQTHKPTKPQAHKPQPHKPTNHFPKTLARRNARKRSAAPPWGVPGVLDGDTQFLSGFDRSQISKPQIPGSRCRAQDPCQTRRGFNPSLPPRRPRTFRRADPKIPPGRPFGFKVSDFSRFWPTFAHLKNHQKIAFLKTPPKSILSRHLAPLGRPKLPFDDFLVDFRLIFGAIFHRFLRYFRKRLKTRKPL